MHLHFRQYLHLGLYFRIHVHMLWYPSILRLLWLTFFKLRWYLSLDSRFIRTFRSSLTKISWAIINNLYQRVFVYHFQPGHRQYVFWLSMVVSVVEGCVGKKIVYKVTGPVRCLCFTDFSKLRANVCNGIFTWSCNRKSNSVLSFCPYRIFFSEYDRWIFIPTETQKIHVEIHTSQQKFPDTALPDGVYSRIRMQLLIEMVTPHSRAPYALFTESFETKIERPLTGHVRAPCAFCLPLRGP